MRHPIDRMISEFYFTLPEKLKEFKNQSRNLDFDACIEQKKCVTEPERYQMTYFCGSSNICQMAGHPEALQRKQP